jgi:hypothetical protein
MKKILLITLFISVLISSCKKADKGEEGDPGPSYYKTANGTVTSTIYYKYANGDTAIVPCSYDSYLSNLDNVFYLDSSSNSDPYYGFDIVRYNSDDASNFIRISTCWANFDKTKDSSFLEPYNFIFGISRVATNSSTLFAFATMSDVYNYYQMDKLYVGEDVTITNYYLNPKSHRLTFDYEVVLSPYSLESNYITDYSVSPIVKGSVDVVLTKSPYETDVCYNFND